MAHIQVSIGKKASRQDPKDPFKTNMQIRKAPLNLCIINYLLDSYQADLMQGLIFSVATVFITNLQNT